MAAAETPRVDMTERVLTITFFACCLPFALLFLLCEVLWELWRSRIPGAPQHILKRLERGERVPAEELAEVFRGRERIDHSSTETAEGRLFWALRQPETMPPAQLARWVTGEDDQLAHVGAALLAARAAAGDAEAAAWVGAMHAYALSHPRPRPWLTSGLLGDGTLHGLLCRRPDCPQEAVRVPMPPWVTW